jgi:HEAT repeat protein
MPMRLNSRQSAVGSRPSPVRSRQSTVAIVLLYVALAFRPAASAQQYTFEEVASGLKHQDVGTRLRAIQILKDADYAEAAVPIAETLADSDDRVQLAAIDAERALFTTRAVPRRKKIGFVVEVRTVAGGDAAAAGRLALKARAVPPQLLTGLAVALRDNNPRVRAEAIGLAALLAPVACLSGGPLKPDTAGGGRPCPDTSHIGNALIDNINSREALLRRAAMQALGQVRHRLAVQALSDQLSYYQRGPDAMAALEGLAGIGHQTSAPIFEQQLTSSNADMRRLAVEGLARAGNREVLAILQQMGQNERSNGVLLALHFANVKLGAIETSLQQLVASLADASHRSTVLPYLLELSQSMAPALAESLKDPLADVRRLVADVLGFSLDASASVTSALEVATKDPDPDVAAAARQAIERLKL